MADQFRVRVLNLNVLSNTLVDKYNRDVSIVCGYDPQGINIKIIEGNHLNGIQHTVLY